jgi:hypothetical protein
MWNLQPDDRVLCLTIPPLREAAAIGRTLSAGCLVALGTKEEVDEARRALSELDNLMFVESAGSSIPWRDAFFTKIVVPHEMKPLAATFGNELHRVLAPGGEIIYTARDA